MDIPEAIWLEISVFLEAKELCVLALVSKRFYSIATNNYPWRVIMIQKLNKAPKSLENVKKSLAEINCMANKIISDFQFETHVLEMNLEQERTRQNKAFDYKRKERQLHRLIKQCGIEYLE